MSENLLKKEMETYEKNKVDFISENLGKFVLIKEEEIIVFFETQNDAIKVGIDKFGNTPFLVKKIEDIEQSQNFTSNLIWVTESTKKI